MLTYVATCRDDASAHLLCPPSRLINQTRRRKFLLYTSSFLVAAALLVVGICTQWGVKPMVTALGSGKVELFRWMYFFSLWPPLWVVTRVANNRLFIYIEKVFFM